MAICHGIAFLCTTHALGGIELNVLRIASWLRERGHHCGIYGVANAPLLDRASHLNLYFHSIGTPRRYGAFKTALDLAKDLSRNTFDVLIMNAPRDMNLGVLTKRFSGGAASLIQLQHMQFGASKRDAFHSWEYRHLDAWVSPLPWLALQTRQNTTLTDERIHILPFGIELDRFERRPAKTEARKQLGLPLDAHICGTIGRFDQGKGQEYLLHAVADLAGKGLRIHALLVGEDTRGEQQGYGAQLHALAREMNIADRVHFRPFLDDVETAYAAMDIFALTSISETYGMVTVEAMASGLPIVATNSAGTPDIIDDGRTGLLIPVRDHAALAGAIDSLLTDTELANRLALAANVEAARRFSHHTYCAGMEKLISDLRTLR